MGAGEASKGQTQGRTQHSVGQLLRDRRGSVHEPQPARQDIPRGSRARHEKALITYLMAGDPGLAETEQLVLELEKAGADIIELGVPFSDPIADGPVIQQAAERALRSGTTLRGILSMVARVTNTSPTGSACPHGLLQQHSCLRA